MFGSDTDQARRGRWAAVEYANGEPARIVGLCREEEDARAFADHLAATMPRHDGTIAYTYRAEAADAVKVTA